MWNTHTHTLHKKEGEKERNTHLYTEKGRENKEERFKIYMVVILPKI